MNRFSLLLLLAICFAFSPSNTLAADAAEASTRHLETALKVARQYIEKQKLEVSGRFLVKAEWTTCRQNEPGAPAEPCWNLKWLTKEQFLAGSNPVLPGNGALVLNVFSNGKVVQQFENR